MYNVGRFVYLNEEKKRIIRRAIGNVINRQRLALGVDLDTLYNKYGLSNRLILNIERAKTEPTMEVFMKLAHAFGMKCENLCILLEEELEKQCNIANLE